MLHATHEVLNQPPPLAGYDVAADPAMLAALQREGAGWAAGELHELGKLAGSARRPLSPGSPTSTARSCVPTTATATAIDEVEFHPAWHQLMDTAVRHGLHAAPWQDAQARCARRPRGQVLCLGTGGSRARLPDLDDVCGGARASPLPRTGRPVQPAARRAVYQPGMAPPDGKAGLLAGMAMTEKQGGSDVRSNTTMARPAPSGGGTCYVLTGHKWFNSAPMCDLFLVLAQAERARG